MAQEILYRVGKGLVQVLGKRGPRVVGQDPDEHDGIVLDMGTIEVVLGEEGANLSRGGGGCIWAGDGRLDNGGEMEHFFALAAVSTRAFLGRSVQVTMDIPSWPRPTHRRASVACQLARRCPGPKRPTTPLAALASGVSAFGSPSPWAGCAVGRLRIKLPKLRRFLSSMTTLRADSAVGNGRKRLCLCLSHRLAAQARFKQDGPSLGGDNVRVGVWGKMQYYR